jgi:hypothetical protein
VAREERVLLDLVRALRAEPPRGVALEEPGHHALRVPADVRREVEKVGQDPLVHHIHILVVERREPSLPADVSDEGAAAEEKREGRTIIS